MALVLIILAILAAVTAVLAHLYFLPFRLGAAPGRLLDEDFLSHPPDLFPDIKLYIDGEEAFGAVFAAIGGARETLHIQTFIWKDDAFGNKMAQAAISAADRGVKVTLSKDALGTFFEVARKGGKLGLVFTSQALKSHPNIRLAINTLAPVDHSKYFIVDGKAAIFGGMNIADEYHAKWHDYMIGLDDPSLAAAFEAKTLRHEPWPPAAPFVIATNTWQGAQVRTGLLQVIGAAGKRLVIQHAYFSANIILVAIKAALARGVAVDLILPRAPATHGPANRMAINQLLASPHADRLRVFHFPRMSHAKTIVADGAIVAIGSANLTPRSLYVSGETVMFAHFPAEHPFIGKLTARLERDIEECERITVPFPMGAREKARAMVGKYIW